MQHIPHSLAGPYLRNPAIQMVPIRVGGKTIGYKAIRAVVGNNTGNLRQ